MCCKVTPFFLMMVFLYGVKMFKMSYLLGLSSFPVAILCFGE